MCFCFFQVVRLASPTFNYTAFDRAKARSKKFATERFPDTLGKHVKAGLPAKVWLLVRLQSVSKQRFHYILLGILVTANNQGTFFIHNVAKKYNMSVINTCIALMQILGKITKRPTGYTLIITVLLL